MNKKKKSQAAQATTRIIIEATQEGKKPDSVPQEWRNFGKFWQQHVESNIAIHRANAKKLAATAVKIEQLAKKKRFDQSAEGEMAKLLTAQPPQGSADIVSAALKKFSEHNGKASGGRMLNFPFGKIGVISGAGVLAAAAVALFVVLTRPQLQYAPATPAQMQTALSVLPEQDEGMGLLEERDSEEVAAFVFGFYTELAKSFDVNPPSREFSQMLAKFADALKRRGLTAEAALVDSLFESARGKSLTGGQLLSKLNTLNSMLTQQISRDDLYWYESGAWVAKKLVRDLGMGNWGEVEESGLEKVRKELAKRQPRTEKMRSIHKALASIFAERDKKLPAIQYKKDQRGKYGELFENAGIHRF